MLTNRYKRILISEKIKIKISETALTEAEIPPQYKVHKENQSNVTLDVENVTYARRVPF